MKIGRKNEIKNYQKYIYLISLSVKWACISHVSCIGLKVLNLIWLVFGGHYVYIVHFTLTFAENIPSLKVKQTVDGVEKRYCFYSSDVLVGKSHILSTTI
jgi:hypothetical protein